MSKEQVGRLKLRLEELKTNMALMTDELEDAKRTTSRPMKLTELEAIDEATNILMDHVVRPKLNITDTVDSELDDEVYSTIHSNIKLTLTQIWNNLKPLE